MVLINCELFKRFPNEDEKLINQFIKRISFDYSRQRNSSAPLDLEHEAMQVLGQLNKGTKFIFLGNF